MKRILINATHNEEIRVALCKGNHLYDFDLENRTREQKKSNIYKAHVTRVEPSLEAVFVEYGYDRQGFLPVREIAQEYLGGNPREENIKNLIKEGDSLIVQVEKEERGNKGAALTTYVSLAGRYLVLMPNNPRGGGISRQISGKMREDMKRIVSNLTLPKGMSIIIRTAGIGKTQEDLQHDLNHLIRIWENIGKQSEQHPSPRLVHQEAGVVTRAVRDYLRDDIAEVWIDNEDAYNEAANFIASVMPKQSDKLRKYIDYEPMFARFGIEKQIETAYHREVRLPSGGSIVIDQTEAMVAIDINSAKSTKGSDVAETAYHTNLEAADEIARQLRLRDMGGLVVIDFIDMYEQAHQKDVEKRLIEATKYDRARVQFGEISRFGLMEMSRQRLRPSLEESTGFKCPRCNGNGMIRDLRSLSLSIMRQIEMIALKERQGELQAEVPTDIAAFLLNEKRDSLVYLEQDSGTRITILPHAHMESPNFNLHFNRDGFAPSSYERITDSQEQETTARGYDVNWQTADIERPESQPIRQPKRANQSAKSSNNRSKQSSNNASVQNQQNAQVTTNQPQAVAWLSNLFAPTQQAKTTDALSSQDAAQAIEAIVNSGGQSLGAFGQVDVTAIQKQSSQTSGRNSDTEEEDNNQRRKNRKPKHNKPRKKDRRKETGDEQETANSDSNKQGRKPKRESNSKRESRGEFERKEALTNTANSATVSDAVSEQPEASTHKNKSDKHNDKSRSRHNKSNKSNRRDKSVSNADNINVQVTPIENNNPVEQVIHISLDEDKKTVKDVKAKSKPSDDINADTKSDFAEKTDAKANNIDSVKTTESIETTSTKVAEPEPQIVNLVAGCADIAQASGRATNDPRVVKAALQKQSAPKPADQTTATKVDEPVAISGNVGDFIRSTLTNADERLASEGVITCFIEAVNGLSVAKSSANNNDVEQTSENNNNSSASEFSFVNYGYAQLSTTYLTQFNQQVESVSQHNVAQGKTAVQPASIGKRANNDPRGQHPDYVESESIENAEVEIVENNTTENFPAEANTLDVDTTDTKTEAVKVTDTSDESKQNAETIVQKTTADTEVKTESTSVNDDASVDLDNTVNDTDNSESSNADDVLEERTKTTFERYKNMLESVSEQLLPKDGNMILSSIPVPKSRTRKTKKSTTKDDKTLVSNIDTENEK